MELEQKYRSLKMQNLRLIRSMKNLRERIEFLEVLALNTPEFDKAFENIKESEDAELNKLNTIIKIYCNYKKISKDLLMSKSRKREFVERRQEVHYLGKKYTDLSLSSIGLLVGLKNHSTVLYSNKVVNDRLSYDKKLIYDLEKIEKRIRITLKLNKLRRKKKILTD